jgi:hypothetical protein
MLGFEKEEDERIKVGHFKSNKCREILSNDSEPTSRKVIKPLITILSCRFGQPYY